MKAKKFKGERLEAGQYNENTSEHLHRYALAMELCQNKKVLDIACGDGYGTNLISSVAAFVTGVDIDASTIENAKRKYIANNIEFKIGNVIDIPFSGGEFDVVISFETLEHHDKHGEMMKEIRRVLKPDGLCIISTPDKFVYTDKKNFHNPYHIKELYKEEFQELVQSFFKNVYLFNQRFLSGSMITPETANNVPLESFEGNFSLVERKNLIEAEYLIAFASDAPVKLPEPSIFLDKNFAQNKILEFQRSSLRYKLGNTLLKPVRLVKAILGMK